MKNAQSAAVAAATLNEIEAALAKVRAITSNSALADLAHAKLQSPSRNAEAV